MSIYQTKGIGVLGALVLVTICSCRQPNEATAAGLEPSSIEALREVARASDETWLILADEPAVHLWWARDFHQRGNLASAEAELSKSATMLRWGASHVPAPDEKRDFMKAAEELDAVAGDASSASSAGAASLEHALDDAYRVLATYHVRAALLEWEAGDQPLAAKLLSATATEIEQRLAVLGSPTVTELDEAVAEARYVAERLGSSKAPADHEVRHAIERLQGVLDRLVEVSPSR